MSLKDKLAEIEKQAEERQKQRDAALGQHQQKADALMGEFAQVKAALIRPVFEEARDYLLSMNHGAIIEDNAQAITLTFCRETVVDPLEIKSSRTSNNVRFFFDRNTLMVEVDSPKAAQPNQTLETVRKSVEPHHLTRASVETLVEAAVRAVIQ